MYKQTNKQTGPITVHRAAASLARIVIKVVTNKERWQNKRQC